jgi:hypothetical protein
VSTGDGGVVAVDSLTLPGKSIRYSSYYDFVAFRREVYDANNQLLSQVYPPLTVLDGGPTLVPQFYTPLKLNTVTPTRLVIGGANSVYESLDQGDTIAEIGRGIVANGSGPNPIAYGGKGNPDILFVGSGSQVYVRKQAAPASLLPSPTYAGGFVLGLAINPDDPKQAFVVSQHGVSRTTNAGGAWTGITGNLPTGPGILRSIAYCPGSPDARLVVGSDMGVYVSVGPEFRVGLCWALASQTFRFTTSSTVQLMRR